MNGIDTLQRADPLGALAGRRLTIAAASAVTVLAVVFTWASSAAVDNWPVAIVAVGLTLVASVVLIVRSSFRFGPFERSWALAVLAFGMGAHFASTVATWRVTAPDGNWSPYVLALLLLALVPYRPVRDIVVLTIVTTAWVAMLTVAQEFSNGFPGIPGLRVIVAVTSVLALPLGGVAFARSVLTFLSRWRADALAATDEESRRQEVAITRAVQQTRVSILNRDVVPFYTEVLQRDHVDADDPRRAAELSGSIRSVMLADNERTWLDEMMAPQLRSDHAAVMQSPVDDVHGLALHMDLDQRAAVRALVAAIRELPGHTDRAIQVTMNPVDASTICEAMIVATVGHERQRLQAALRPYLALMSTVFNDFSYEINHDKLTMRFCYDRP